MKISKILKWVTIAMFMSSVAFFFLPYRIDAMGVRHNAFSIIKIAFNEMSNDWGMEMIMRFAVPVGLCFIAATVMIIRTNIATSAVATILSSLSLCLYRFYISDYMNDSYGIEIGLIINYIISIVGIILPIITIVIAKIENKKVTNEK